MADPLTPEAYLKKHGASSFDELDSRFPQRLPDVLKFSPDAAKALSTALGVEVGEEIGRDELQSLFLAKSINGQKQGRGAGITRTGPSAADVEKDAARGLSISQRLAQGASPEFQALKSRSILAKEIASGATPEQAAANSGASLDEANALFDQTIRSESDYIATQNRISSRFKANPKVQAIIAKRDAPAAPTDPQNSVSNVIRDLGGGVTARSIFQGGRLVGEVKTPTMDPHVDSKARNESFLRTYRELNGGPLSIDSDWDKSTRRFNTRTA